MASPAHDPIEAAALARVGSTLKGKWNLDSLLGVGGMAAVYAATHRNQKRVAIKVLHSELCTNAIVRQRFLREGYAANSVGHPNAVSVHDDDVTDDGCIFLVMDLLEGETLEARWKRLGKRLPAEEVLCCAEHVLDALAAAHAKGIIHRDLKPENLFLTESGTVKILDFGIARLHDLGLPPSRTRSGSTLGTPGFMAPEQALGRNDQVDAQSDLWSVGATMFTLLSGRHVHDGSTAAELLIGAATRRAPALARAMPELPAFVTDVVDRALVYDKSERWPDAVAMRSAVRRALVQLDSGADLPAAKDAIRRAPRLLLPGDGMLALGAVVMLLASLLLVRFSSSDGAQPRPQAQVTLTSPAAAHHADSRRGPEVVPILGDLSSRPVSVDDLPLDSAEQRLDLQPVRRSWLGTSLATASAPGDDPGKTSRVRPCPPRPSTSRSRRRARSQRQNPTRSMLWH